MPRPCSICTHPDRKKIEAALFKESLRGISRIYAVSEDALSRHKRHIKRSLATVDKQAGRSFAKSFDDLYDQLGEIEKKAETTADKLAAIREKRAMLQMFVQLGFQEALRRQQQEQQQEYKDVTPGVLEIINKEYEE